MKLLFTVFVFMPEKGKKAKITSLLGFSGDTNQLKFRRRENKSPEQFINLFTAVWICNIKSSLGNSCRLGDILILMMLLKEIDKCFWCINCYSVTCLVYWFMCFDGVVFACCSGTHWKMRCHCDVWNKEYI